MAEPYRYTMADLEARTGLSTRTVRYYIQEGLLPPAHGRGPSATYDLGHLLRLQAITQLKANRLPLDEIRDRLAGLSDNDIAALLEVNVEPAQDEDLAAGKQGPVELKGRVLCGGAHQGDDPLLHPGQEAVLLGARERVLRVGGQPRVVDRAHAALCGEELRQRLRVRAIALHPQRERLGACGDVVRLLRRQGCTPVAQPALPDLRDAPQLALGALVRVGDVRVARPVVETGVGHRTGERVAMSADVLGRGVHRDVDAVVDGPAQHRAQLVELLRPHGHEHVGRGAHHQNPVRVAGTLGQHLGLIDHECVALTHARGVQQHNLALGGFSELGRQVIAVAH